MVTPPFRQDVLPRFSTIDPTQIPSTIRACLDKNREKIAALLAQPGPYTWDNLLQPLEDLSDELNKIWSPVSHLHGVMETEELRKAYNETLPLLTEYHTELSQNEKLFQAISQVAQSPEFANLNPAQKKIIENDLRDFKLAGIHLPADKKAELAALQKELSQLTTKFSENVLDSTQGWILHVTDKNQLEGLPSQAVQLAIDNAAQRGLEGYVFTLDFPSYSTAIKYLRNREMRKVLYEAYSTRASDKGPNAGKWDNTEVIEDILRVRHKIAQIVGFENFAEYSLATKMAKTPDEVLRFLKDLLTRSRPIAEEEFKEIASLSALDGISMPEVWDIPYYSEKLQENTFHFSQEDLRPYFPIDKTLQGMFTLVNKLYGITIKKEEGIDVWHPDVSFFTVYDDQNQLRGGFYIDLYARPHKRDGAWMDECRTRRLLMNNEGVQQPVAYLTCNFMPPVDNQKALLTHDDVLTLFHEFGHCLHHMLTKVDYPSVAGINGVPWDAVEFPSQFMENYCWEKETLSWIAEHYQTKAPLPNDLYQKMVDAKHFQTGLQMARQLEFSLFDFRLHLQYDPNKPNQTQSLLNEVRRDAAIVRVPDFNRFQNSFSHIFAGGYAAGYYSYKWAEVLSSDAYSEFEEKGLYDRKTGKSFMENILQVGGVRDPMDAFVAFRGREPRIDALLRQSGIIKSGAL